MQLRMQQKLVMHAVCCAVGGRKQGGLLGDCWGRQPKTRPERHAVRNGIYCLYSVLRRTLGVFVMSTPALPHPIDRFVQAVNRGDTKTFLAFFPKAGAVIDSGRRFGGQDAIRRWS